MLRPSRHPLPGRRCQPPPPAGRRQPPGRCREGRNREGERAPPLASRQPFRGRGGGGGGGLCWDVAGAREGPRGSAVRIRVTGSFRLERRRVPGGWRGPARRGAVRDGPGPRGGGGGGGVWVGRLCPPGLRALGAAPAAEGRGRRVCRGRGLRRALRPFTGERLEGSLRGAGPRGSVVSEWRSRRGGEGGVPGPCPRLRAAAGPVPLSRPGWASPQQVSA